MGAIRSLPHRRGSPAPEFAGQARQELLASELTRAPGNSLLRGLMIAGLLATPFWIALYLLLR